MSGGSPRPALYTLHSPKRVPTRGTPYVTPTQKGLRLRVWQTFSSLVVALELLIALRMKCGTKAAKTLQQEGSSQLEYPDIVVNLPLAHAQVVAVPFVALDCDEVVGVLAFPGLP